MFVTRVNTGKQTNRQAASIHNTVFSPNKHKRPRPKTILLPVVLYSMNYCREVTALK